MSMTLPHRAVSPRGIPVLAALVALCGCTAQDPAHVSLEQSVATPRGALLADHAAPQRLAALPADAGVIVTVRDHDDAHGLRQDLLFDGSAVRKIPNGLTVLARADARASASKPTRASIAKELSVQFPGLAMQVVTRPASNAYGSYGLALGRGDNDIRCLYAWQWIEDSPRLARAAVPGPASVRVRLCRAESTFDAMAALMDGLTLGLDAPQDEAPVRAADTAPLVVGESKDAAPAAPRRVARAHHRPIAVAHDTSVVPRATLSSGSARYLAPVSVGALNGAAVTTPEAAKLSQDLPPQAYLGPSAGKIASIAARP